LKLAIVSHTLPPSSSGQAVVIYRLLQTAEPTGYCLVSQQRSDEIHHGLTSRLPGKYFRIRTYYAVTHGLRRRRWFKYLALITAPAVTLARTLELWRIFQRDNVTRVLGCTGGDLLEIPAAYVAARLSNARFYLYMFDRYGDQWQSRDHWLRPIRSIGRRVEHWLVTHSDGIIVPNEKLQSDLRDEFAVESTVLHNPCDLSQYSTNAVASVGMHGVRRVVYTGAIYDAHFDAFERMLDALEQLGPESIKLEIYTAEPEERLRQNNISGRAELHEHEHPTEMPKVQQSADILFLPLAFNSPYPAIIRTSSPGKMGEYLAAGRPILVHAPADSFPAWYFRTHDCGVVVDQPDVQLLVLAIKQIISDPLRGEELARRAIQRAKEDFDINTVRRIFFAALGIHR
jgi:glycosyltransferase involved in cell wall biosynthesis